MAYPPSTPLRDVKELSAEARELLRKWCPRAVTIEDFDARPVRVSFATMIACKERTLAGRIYKQLGLAPLELAYQDDVYELGCLYVKAPLAEVRAALVAAYARHGLSELPRVETVDMGSHSPHTAPRVKWRDDVVVVQPDDDGFVAVGSREWELAFPGSNALAVELSRVAPVLAITAGPAFDEISVYTGGEVLRAWVPRGKRTYRSKAVSTPLSIEMLENTFGTSNRWQEIADLVGTASTPGDDDDDAVGAEALMAGFAHRGFWSEIESILDTHVYDPPPVEIPELMGFSKAKESAKDKATAHAVKTAKSATSRPKAAATTAKSSSGVSKPGTAATPTDAGAAVLAIISRAIFEKQHPDASVGDVLLIDRYTSSNPALAKIAGGGSLVLVTVRPGDVLWLVAILDAPVQKDGEWVAQPNRAAVTEIEQAQLRFASGATLKAAPGKLGMSLQTPRALADEVLASLRGTARTR